MCGMEIGGLWRGGRGGKAEESKESAKLRDKSLGIPSTVVGLIFVCLPLRPLFSHLDNNSQKINNFDKHNLR